jgi:hypothetical protein
MVLATLQGLPMNFIWRSLPFVFDNFTLAGAIEFDASLVAGRGACAAGRLDFRSNAPHASRPTVNSFRKDASD